MPSLEAEERLATCRDEDVFRLALLATGSTAAAEKIHAARREARSRSQRPQQ